MSKRSLNFKIGIIIPSFFESQFINRSIPGVSNVIFGVSGMGKLRAAWTARTMQEAGCRAILLTGFAGGLLNVNHGDVVTATKAVEGDYDTRPLETFPNSLDCEPLPINGVFYAEFISQDRFLKEDIYTEIGESLGHASGEAMVTDMEAYAVAFAGRSLGIPVFIVKMISDIVGENSEKDFLSACSKMSDRLNEVISESISLIRKKVLDEKGR